MDLSPTTFRLLKFAALPGLLMLLASFTLRPRSALAEADAPAAQDFRANCAACHGWNGEGEGPIGELMIVKPPNLRLLAHRNGGTFPADTVIRTLEGNDIPRAHGTSRMPVWGDWFAAEAIADSLKEGAKRPPPDTVEKRIQRLVDYLRSIQE